VERPATSLFIVASKSGSTIEVDALAAEAARRVRAAGAADPGSHSSRLPTHTRRSIAAPSTSASASCSSTPPTSADAFRR